MADSVNTLVVYSSPQVYAVRFTNISDGTGEALATKVNLSTLAGPTGAVPRAATLKEASWNIQGFTSVRLFWDHTTDELMKILSGEGFINYAGFGGLHDPQTGVNGTGNVLFTTAGGAAGATYDITLVFGLEA